METSSISHGGPRAALTRRRRRRRPTAVGSQSSSGRPPSRPSAQRMSTGGCARRSRRATTTSRWPPRDPSGAGGPGGGSARLRACAPAREPVCGQSRVERGRNARPQPALTARGARRRGVQAAVRASEAELEEQKGVAEELRVPPPCKRPDTLAFGGGAPAARGAHNPPTWRRRCWRSSTRCGRRRRSASRQRTPRRV
jgi:hypothetical protein